MFIWWCCRTQLPDGSLCVSDVECVHFCGAGVCSPCRDSSHCSPSEYCAYTLLPVVQNECQDYCGAPCLLSDQCGGNCGTCSWFFTCQ